MPGFPTQIVGTPTNRGKARPYEGTTITRRGCRGIIAGSEGRESLLVFGPGRGDAGHASVGDELAHVLVGVDDDAQVHAVHSGIAIDDVNLALEVFRCGRQMGLLHGVQRALEPVDDLAFEVTVFSIPSLASAGILG